MAQNDLLKRYFDAGVAFTALTQARAEAIVKDLVKAGEVQTDQFQTTVTELVERSRQNSEKVLDTIRKEIRTQLAALSIPTRDDVEAIVRRVTRNAPAKKAPAKKAVKKATKKAAPAKRTAKKAVKKATPAKRAAKATR